LLFSIFALLLDDLPSAVRAEPKFKLVDELVAVIELDPAPISQIDSALLALESVYRMEF
jgi:hypothetical protein